MSKKTDYSFPLELYACDDKGRRNILIKFSSFTNVEGIINTTHGNVVTKFDKVEYINDKINLYLNSEIIVSITLVKNTFIACVSVCLYDRIFPFINEYKLFKQLYDDSINNERIRNKYTIHETIIIDNSPIIFTDPDIQHVIITADKNGSFEELFYNKNNETYESDTMSIKFINRPDSVNVRKTTRHSVYSQFTFDPNHLKIIRKFINPKHNSCKATLIENENYFQLLMYGYNVSFCYNKKEIIILRATLTNNETETFVFKNIVIDINEASNSFMNKVHYVFVFQSTTTKSTILITVNGDKYTVEFRNNLNIILNRINNEYDRIVYFDKLKSDCSDNTINNLERFLEPIRNQIKQEESSPKELANFYRTKGFNDRLRHLKMIAPFCTFSFNKITYEFYNNFTLSLTKSVNGLDSSNVFSHFTCSDMLNNDGFTKSFISFNQASGNVVIIYEGLEQNKIVYHILNVGTYTVTIKKEQDYDAFHSIRYFLNGVSLKHTK